MKDAKVHWIGFIVGYFGSCARAKYAEYTSNPDKITCGHCLNRLKNKSKTI